MCCAEVQYGIGGGVVSSMVEVLHEVLKEFAHCVFAEPKQNTKTPSTKAHAK